MAGGALLGALVACILVLLAAPPAASLSLRPPSSTASMADDVYSFAGAPKPYHRGSSSSKANRKQQKEQLYEAYNLLHSLAQDFQKPFDATAILIVGQQTGGKSALIEALMGFQFNQVGGGTKTRRPIALRMQYNPRCSQPHCFLTLDNGKEEPRSLKEIQAYIEGENKRLENDELRCFDPREIMVRVEYRFCPNMIVIDTPGLLSAPAKLRHMNEQQRQLQQAAKEAEHLVLEKMKCQDYLILCVEDTTDWKHSTTRNIVMQADPDLRRTVLVTTKFDTKLPQFGTSEDLEDFLRAPLIQKLYPQMLGGPFYTSVPCGRVGMGKDSAFISNEVFVEAVKKVEKYDHGRIEARLGSVGAAPLLQRVGVSRLRRFLEKRVEECYRRNVAKIVPLLQGELRSAEMKLGQTNQELEALSMDFLKKTANQFREFFLRSLGSVIQGTIQASPAQYGETLETEQLRGGSFLDAKDVPAERWERIMDDEVGNAHHRLFGGAQYHRALREFTLAVRLMKTPVISEDEIANAAGVGDMHDGVNFMRAACVIAVEKARSSFEPLLEALRHRTTHIMKRLYPITEYMLQRNGKGLEETHHQPFQEIVRRIYENFVHKTVDDCLVRCRDDLKALTRFVTWDLHERSAGALQRSLPQSHLIQVYSMQTVAATAPPSRRTEKGHKAAQQQQQQHHSLGLGSGKGGLDHWEEATALSPSGSDGFNQDNRDLLQLMEEAACVRNSNRTNAVVSALVQHIIRSWREHFARSVAMKFNCFFLMPFIDEFPFYLRQELDRVYEGDMANLFDISELKSALKRKRDDLIAECKANERLQGKFDVIDSQLRASKVALEDIDSEDDEEVGAGPGSPPAGGVSGNAGGAAGGAYGYDGRMGEEELEEEDILSADLDGLDTEMDGIDEGGFDFASGGGSSSSSRRFEDDMDDLLGPVPPPPGNRKL